MSIEREKRQRGGEKKKGGGGNFQLFGKEHSKKKNQLYPESVRVAQKNRGGASC